MVISVLGIRSRFNLSFRVVLCFAYTFLHFIQVLLNTRNMFACIDRKQGRNIQCQARIVQGKIRGCVGVWVYTAIFCSEVHLIEHREVSRAECASKGTHPLINRNTYHHWTETDCISRENMQNWRPIITKLAFIVTDHLCIFHVNISSSLL